MTRTPEQHFARYRDAGDLAALAAVFDAVAGQLLLVAGHLVRDGALAEDLVQTTFVEAMQHAARYDARRALLPWLAQILTHHAKKSQRQWRRGQLAQPPGPHGERGPVERAFDREVMAAIESGLARLEAPYREVLTLRLVHELWPAAIAHAIGCPPETVRTRLKRGIERLRRHLPAGLATSLALLLASGRGLAAVRAFVLRHARQLAAKTTAGAASATILGGLLMKQFLLRATIVVAVLLLGWWGVELTGLTTAPPGPGGEPAALVVTSAPAAPGATGQPGRQSLAMPVPAPTGIAFVGRCVAAGTGKPLGGVNATACFDVASRSVCDNELGGEMPAGLVTSDAEGRFRIACERRPGATYDVRIGNREHVHRVRTFGPYAADQTIDLGDVPLLHGVHVSLRVVDRRGAAVPGVRITASATWAVGRNEMLMLDTGFPWRSDAQGEVHLPYSMRPGHYEVVWLSNELPQDRSFAAVDVPPDVAHHDAVLVWPVEDLAAAITGDVIDDQGRPVSDLSLGAEGGGTRGNALTLADGTFRMPRIGPYDANARGPVEFGLPEPTCGLELVGHPACGWGDRGVHLTVRPTAVLHVRAIDATTGAAVHDFDVACAAYLDGADAPAVVGQRHSPLERLADGSVRRHLARCRHDVQVFPRDARLAPSTKVVWDPRGGEELVVPLNPLRTCTVRVVTLDGEPVAGTELWTLLPIEAIAGAPAATGWQEVSVPVAEEQRLVPTTRWLLRHGIQDAPLGTARTGGDGRAQVLVPADADVVIAALGPGHVPKALVGRAVAGAEVEFRVECGASVCFLLTPKEVVERLARSAQQRIVAAGGDYPGKIGVGLQMARVAAEQDPARTEAAIVIPISPDGICEQRGLRPGRYDIALAGHIDSGAMDGIFVWWQPGPVSVRDGQRNEIPLDVSRLAIGRLQCQVLLNGRPWSFGSGNLWSMRWPEYRNIVDFQTDAEGRFDVEAVPGEYRLGLLDVTNRERSGNCCAVEPVRVVAGATTQLVLTARAVRARVRVVQANGEPADGLTVTTDYTTEPRCDVAWTTDAGGWITIPLAPPMPFHLVVTNPNGPMRAGRRSQSSGDALLGPFQIPATGDTAEFRAVLPEGWR